MGSDYRVFWFVGGQDVSTGESHQLVLETPVLDLDIL